jgi:hypothetical protein
LQAELKGRAGRRRSRCRCRDITAASWPTSLTSGGWLSAGVGLRRRDWGPWGFFAAPLTRLPRAQLQAAETQLQEQDGKWRLQLGVRMAGRPRLPRASCPSSRPRMYCKPSSVLYCFFVLGVGVHSVVSGERASEERLRLAKCGLATALGAFWHRSHVPAGSGLGVVGWRGR